MTMIDKAIKILQETNDGNDLSELELWLVQEAVNNHLSERGKEKFEEIYQKYA